MHTKHNIQFLSKKHSHIKGLGAANGQLNTSKDNLIGQEEQRKLFSVFHQMLKNNEGKIVFLVGETGTGKSALANAFIKQSDRRFYEYDSSQISSIEDLKQAIRKVTYLKIKETLTVIEGEIIDLKSDKIILKTTDMESEFSIGTKMVDQLIKEKISVGDVINIVKESGIVTKVGKSFVRTHEYDTLGLDTKFVPCPEGELVTIKDKISELSLHDLDNLNKDGVPNLFSTGEITSEVRNQIDKKVIEWIEEGKAEMKIGTLLIENADLLQREYFAYLNRINDEKDLPFIICTINDIKSLTNEYYKMLASKCYVLLMKEYKDEEVEAIINLRVIEENFKCNKEIISKLTELSRKSGLKTILNVLQICIVFAGRNKGKLSSDDIVKIYTSFINN